MLTNSQQALRDALAKAQNLPSAPTVALEVAKAADKPDINVDQISAILVKDPVLSARLLKLSNSAMFRRRAEITSLSRACAHLGIRTTKLWVLSIALFDSFSKTDKSGFDYSQHRMRSLRRAVASSLIASVVNPKITDEAFITGLLSSIGEIALVRCLPKEREALMAATRPGEDWPAPVQQRDLLGYSVDELGAILLELWNLPPVICGALLRHAVLGMQDPGRLDLLKMDQDGPASGPDAEMRELSKILHAARCIEAVLWKTNCPVAFVRLLRSLDRLYPRKALEIEEAIIASFGRRTEELAEELAISKVGRFDTRAALDGAQLEFARSRLRQFLAAADLHLAVEEGVEPIEEVDPRSGVPEIDLISKISSQPASSEDALAPAAGAPLGVLAFRPHYARSSGAEGQAHTVDYVVATLARRLLIETAPNQAVFSGKNGEFLVITPRLRADEIAELAKNLLAALRESLAGLADLASSIPLSVGSAYVANGLAEQLPAAVDAALAATGDPSKDPVVTHIEPAPAFSRQYVAGSVGC